MFQKTFTEDYLTGKRKVNHGERAKYYVEDTHPAIVSKDIFDRVQEEMKRRERIVRNDDGSIEASKSKFNSKYILGNFIPYSYIADYSSKSTSYLITIPE